MARLKKVVVDYISLVKNPANKRDIVYKSKDGKFTDEKELKITKSTAEGLVYGTVYEPNVKDSQGDWADEQTIKTAAHQFLAKGNIANVDQEHDEQASGAKVVESYVDDKGAWQVAIQMDPKSDTFQKVQKGEIKGLSMGAWCEKSDEEPPEIKPEVNEEMLKALKGIQEGFKSINERLEKLEKSMEKVPKSRQLKIDGENVKTEKSEDEVAFKEFSFNELN